MEKEAREREEMWVRGRAVSVAPRWAVLYICDPNVATPTAVGVWTALLKTLNPKP